MSGDDPRAAEWEATYESASRSPVRHKGTWWLISAVQRRINPTTGAVAYTFRLVETNPPPST